MSRTTQKLPKLASILFMIIVMNESSFANDQIGNSYFSSQTSTRQIGAAIEEHRDFNNYYLFTNGLFAHNIYYELRINGIYHYITRKPPEYIPISSERNVLGYGSIGTLGYNIVIDKDMSFLPFIRVHYLKNTSGVYADTFGNQLYSDDYAVFLGAKLSRKLTSKFAIYTQYFAGPQKSWLQGKGIFSTLTQPTVQSFISILEFGSPYKIKKTSITPYMQILRANIHPNADATHKPFNIHRLNDQNLVYGLKIGYDF